MDRSPPPVTFLSITTRHQLCPAFALSSYLEKSFHLLHGNTPFVHTKSGLPLLSGRLSYGIAKAISTFDSSNRRTAHDCRKFGHSLAFTRGVLPKTIHSFLTSQIPPRTFFLSRTFLEDIPRKRLGHSFLTSQIPPRTFFLSFKSHLELSF